MERTLGGALVVMRRQLGARFHKCLKSDKPQKVLIKNLPLDFQNVQWGAVGCGTVMQSLLNATPF